MDIENLALLEEKINLLLTTTKKLREQVVRLTQDKQELTQQLEESKTDVAEIFKLKELLKKLEEENQDLLKERDTIKTRVENIISELDSIDLSEPSSELFTEKQ